MLNMPRAVTEGITTCAGLLKPVKSGPISRASVSERISPSAMLAASMFGMISRFAAPLSFESW